MATIMASRVYEKESTEKKPWGGRIGKVELVFQSESDINVTLDGKPLPAVSVNYFVHFALQSLQDAYAGSDSLTEAIAEFEKKRDRILAGTLGAREVGASMEQKLMVEYAVAALVKKYGDKERSPDFPDVPCWAERTEDECETAVAEALAKNEAHFRNLATLEIARRKRVAEENARSKAEIKAAAEAEIEI